MKNYDFALLGGGAAGLSLAYALVNSQLRERSILIVDKEAKDRNDRTWCFWTDETTPFDAIAYRAWDRLYFICDGMERELDLFPYRYQLVRGIDFYRFVQEALSEYPNVEILRGEVEQVKDGQEAGEVTVSGTKLQASWIFDSRFHPSNLPPANQGYHSLLQHFKGWEIETPNSVFNPGIATLFDLRTCQQDGIGFYYILPFSDRRALVEYTLFSASLLQDAAYERALRAYIKDRLGARSYQVLDREAGIIPMTDYPFPRRLGLRIMATGTRGGLVKPSTGYAFARIQRDSQAIVSSLLSRGHPFNVPASSPRRRFYDSLMLSVIAHESIQVREILASMFTRNPVARIFRFLDEQTSFSEEVRLLSTLPSRPFLTALARKILRVGR